MVMESLQRLDPPRRLGKFALLARLGEGGMASVFVASIGQGPLARLAAVKLLRAGAHDHDYRQRFLDEASVVVRLHHNNIVDVREAGEVDGQLFITMELIEGRDLADVWDRCAALGRAFPVPLAVYLVREILRGLHYAHTFPGLALVHRDISPSNILLDWAGAVRLADFGLATSAMKGSLTVPGLVFGKVGYMAPEQASRGELDARADVYSCGVVLWELVTGRALRDAEADTKGVARFEATRPSALSRRVDPVLDDIVMRALANDRDARHADAKALMEELSAWLADHAPDTNQETVAEFMGRLFGEARQRDHQAYARLLDNIPRTGVWERTSGPIKRPTRALPDHGVPDREEITEGTILAARYRVGPMLGQGGMGTVYLAEHLLVGRKVAVKVLTHEWSRHEVVAARFKDEARAASAVGHANIVEVFDAGQLDDGRLYIVMELLAGRSLYEEFKTQDQLPLPRACGLIRDVARAIAAAHAGGIIHRDLKPDNVMLVQRGGREVVKVLDFGISASAVRTPEEQRLTRPGHCLGTPEYMAPEQAKGHVPDVRFDVYALGVLLYEALSGDPPFCSDNMVEVLARKATEPAPPIEQRRGDVPVPLRDLVHQCIEIEPERRPASAGEVADRLDRIMVALASGAKLDLAVPLGPSVGATVGDPVAAEGASVRMSPREGEASADHLREPLAAPTARRRLVVGLGLGAAMLVGVLGWRMTGNSTKPAADASDATMAAARVDEVPTVPGDGSRAVPRPAAALDLPRPALAAQGESNPEAATEIPAEPRRKKKASRRRASGTSAKPNQPYACAQTRTEAEAAHKARNWPAVLQHTQSSRCFSGRYRRDYERMRAEALFQVKRFPECAAFAERSKDSKVRQQGQDCRQRGGLAGP